MPAAPLAWWRQPYYDGNGDPVASGSLESYESGTVTPLALYTDAGLTVSAGTTITLNSGGYPQVSGSEVTLFPLPRAYTLILKNSAGAVVRTANDIYALQSASSVNLDISDAVFGEAVSAGDLVYLSDGSGSLTQGRWYKADADFYYASIHPELGFATAAASLGATGTVRIGGVMTGLSGLTAGTTYYASGTAAGLTATAPMNARSVGVAISTTTLRIDISPQWLANGTPLSICDGRLTLTTGTPVTTADVTAATNVFFAPYRGNRVALFDGSKWKVYAFTEITGALGTITSGLPYDVYLYDSSGTLTLEFVAWTNGTTRATALTTQNGVLVKTGTTTKRYLGTFRTTATTTTEDSFAKRYLWNYYNRVNRPMRVLEASNTWAYTVATMRQANGAAGNQLAFVIGVAEVELVAEVSVQAANDTGAGAEAMVAIGLDSTTAAATGCIMAYSESVVVNRYHFPKASLRTYPAVGEHIATWLEWAEATGITTWYGDNNVPLLMQSGITGSIQG